jgi:hypothetical protein
MHTFHLHKYRGLIMLNAVKKLLVAGTIATLGVATANVNSVQAASFSVNVSAQANIFGAGHSSVPTPPVGHPVPGDYGILPPSVRFTAGAGQQLTFSSVTGLVNCFAGANPPYPDNGPDGGKCADDGTNNNSTDILPVYENGIGGVIHQSLTLFLVGVFLDSTSPAKTSLPAANLTGQENQSPIQTVLGVPFYTGDGYTLNPQIQQIFLVPDTATRLFLGFADAADFQGAPRQYQDNTGSLTANFAIGTPNAVPTPALLPGLLGFGFSAWRKRRQAA